MYSGRKITPFPKDEKKTAVAVKHLLQTHASPMFYRFATREALFPAAKYVSASRRKHIPVWKNWETLGKHVSAANVSGNMFPRFAGALVQSCSRLLITGVNSPSQNYQ